MTNEQILESAKAIFGEDIIKNAYSDELQYFSNKEDVINDKQISVSSTTVIVEFTNGKKISIKGAYGWAEIESVKEKS